MSNYTALHVHSDYSLLDSCTQFNDYIELACANNQQAIASTEHGKPLGFVSKWSACEKAGIKFIHGVEIYLTESLENRIRDNYHTLLLARDAEGFLELNRLVSMSCDREHFYYTNRLSFDEFLGISDHIITTSACLASPLNKLSDDHPYYMRLAEKYDFLEIQPHNCDDQRVYNKRLLSLANRLGKPLIVGTDIHSSTKYKAECRQILLDAKHKSYADDCFDLTYKTYDEIVEMFRLQNALDYGVYEEALENTNLAANMCEHLNIDRSIKYPILYGSRENDDMEFEKRVESKFKEKIESGVIPRSQEDAFRKSIDYEMEVFHKLNMSGFMLCQSELVSWCKENGMAIGTARGSVGGSRVAYVTDIIDMNPETWNTNFSRFCNENRVEIGDIDIDVVDTDRPAIFKHVVERFGSDKTGRVASFGTIQWKGVVDDVGRSLSDKWKLKNPDEPERNPWSLKRIDKIKEEYEANPDSTKKKYPELFYYLDGLLDTKVSQSVHPAGMVISPISLVDNYGMFDKDGDNCLMIDMDEAHDVGLAKYDFLILKSVKVLRDICSYIGTHYPRSHEIDFDDPLVWADIGKDPTGIFQFESTFSADSLKKIKPTSIYDMSLVTSCIRPSGQSYRDKLLKRIKHDNTSRLIDDLLKDNMGYLVYQEDIIRFLTEVCGLSGGTADSVRRGIAHKSMSILEKYLPQIVEGYCDKSDKPREVAEQEVKEYLKVIEDASAYMFGYNHSIAYCLLGYYYGYYRYYYPLEFITAYLNNAANDADIKTGTAYANKIGIKITSPKFGASKSTYYFNKDNNTIAKGVSSIKFLSASVAEEMYDVAHSREFKRFVDVLLALKNETALNSRQLDILIKVDFFSDYGNQRELLRINDLFTETFKSGDVKQIKKESVQGSPIEDIIKRHSVGTTKNGKESKSYIITDIASILNETEDAIKDLHMQDLSDILKIQNSFDALGYVGYVSNKEEDRKKLYVTDAHPVRRRRDNKQFGYAIKTKSIGSGVEACFTVFNIVYNRNPIKAGDIIYCQDWSREGQYFTLNAYEKLIS